MSSKTSKQGSKPASLDWEETIYMYDVHVHVDLLYSCLTVTNGLKTKLAPRHHLQTCTIISTGRQCLALSIILWAYSSTNVSTAVISRGLKNQALAFSPWGKGPLLLGFLHVCCKILNKVGDTELHKPLPPHATVPWAPVDASFFFPLLSSQSEQ